MRREVFLDLGEDAERPFRVEKPAEGAHEAMGSRLRPRHGAVAGLAARGEAEGQSRLLRDHDGAEGRPPGRLAGVDRAQLRQRVLRAVDPGAPLVGDPLRAEPAPRLLVGGGEKDEIPLERHLGAHDGEEGGELDDPGGLHVEGAAPVQ